jgi:hypothetical protein
MASRYLIEQKRDGFVVLGRPHRLDIPESPKWLVELCYDEARWRREPVTVCLKPYCLEAVSAGEDAESFGFFRFPGMVAEIARRLMAPWCPPVPECEAEVDGEAPSWVIPWAITKTAKSIGKRVHAEWQRLLQQVDPTVLAVHKKVFAASWSCRQAPVLSVDALYREKYIVHDILAYPAAAAATLACDVCGPVDETNIERMGHWRDLYAPAGLGAYTTLNKTLMSLPGGIPATLLLDLRQLVLPRPIFDRLELAATILAGARTADNFHVFAHATASEIKEAMRRISISLQRQEEAHNAEVMRRYPNKGWDRVPVPAPLSPRRTADIRRAVYYMLDFPEEHRGRIVGLAEKAIRWHGTAGREQEARKSIKRFGTERKLALPPITLPTAQGVRFLETVGDAVTEGEQMQHCIARYSESAVEGRCYLFHIDYRGKSASVEVNRSGQVVQAYGPRNSRNVATHWGARILSEWGRGFGHGEAVNAMVGG